MLKDLATKSKTKTLIVALFVFISLSSLLTPFVANAADTTGSWSITDYIPAYQLAKYTVAPAANAGLTIFFTGIGYALMTFSSFLLTISGWVFDGVVDLTVVKMSETIGTTNGIGLSITEAWATIRDIANIAFIFILLYTAFRTMFMSEYGNIGKSILNIVIIAILINFSLFFTKVVIDASNIVSDGFYRAISQTNEISLTSSLKDTPFTGSTHNYKGISGGYMRLLGLQTWYSADILTNVNVQGPSSILIIGMLSSIFLFVATIILMMAAIMLAARFVILILLMILSPLAFVAYIIPGLSGKFKEWWTSLINQAFFAPIFFGLTWVVFKVGSSFIKVTENAGWLKVPWASLPSDPKGATGLVINFIIIIGLSIAALVLSKKIASQGATSAAFGAITGAATGAFGGSTLGSAGWVGRQTLGRAGTRIAQSTTLRNAAASGGVTGFFAKRTLEAGAKAGEATYDVRGSKTFQSVGGGAFKDLGEARKSAKGGYAQTLKGEEEKEFQKKFIGATPQESYEQQAQEKIATDATERAEKINKDIKAQEDRAKNLRAEMANRPMYEQGQYRNQITEIENAIREQKTKYDAEMATATSAKDAAKKIGDKVTDRAKDYEEAERTSLYNRAFGRNKEVVLALRANAKENKSTKKMLDALAKMQEEDKAKEANPPATT